LFIDTMPAGLYGLVKVSRRLRQECPWDREQTHISLVRHLVEEVNELIEALSALPPEEDPAGQEPDYVAYDGVEEELGDVLLQVLFHSTIAAERGVFGIDDVATRLQEKLVRRHPHVFGDVVADTAAEVASNWEDIKAAEKDRASASRMDGVPAGVSSLERAAQIQRRAAEVAFDWEEPAQIIAVLRAEVEELADAMGGSGDPAAELGDVIFSAVNLARHLGESPEMVLRRATARFEGRFRAMEAVGPLDGLDLEEMEARWRSAKAREP
jgi:MazG family protein